MFVPGLIKMNDRLVLFHVVLKFDAVKEVDELTA
jgi:hypothetical protein